MPWAYSRQYEPTPLARPLTVFYNGRSLGSRVRTHPKHARLEDGLTPSVPTLCTVGSADTTDRHRGRRYIDDSRTALRVTTPPETEGLPGVATGVPARSSVTILCGRCRCRPDGQCPPVRGRLGGQAFGTETPGGTDSRTRYGHEPAVRAAGTALEAFRQFWSGTVVVIRAALVVGPPYPFTRVVVIALLPVVLVGLHVIACASSSGCESARGFRSAV
jgi:hypothetical protein